MLSNIVFCVAVLAATLVVVVLSLLAPSAQTKKPPRPRIALSLYVQHPLPAHNYPHDPRRSPATAYVFHHAITDGPLRTSRVIGRVRGLVLPERSSLAAFNIVYITFDAPEYSGSVGIEARKLVVVGGTGSFAFARGTAVIVRTARPHPTSEGEFYVELKLQLA